MSRRDTLYRAVLLLVYGPIYYFLLFPLAFLVVIASLAVDFVYVMLTGDNLDLPPDIAIRVWDTAEDPISYIASGDERTRPTWLP